MVKKNSEKNIFLFGDSVVQGFWDSRGGWATRLKQYFDNMMAKAHGFPNHEFYYMVFPLGITDDTTQNILERFEFEVEKRMVWETTEEILIFSIGGNDSSEMELAQFERNIREIIRRARRFSSKIAFVDIQPVDEFKTQPVAWDETHFLTNAKIKEFNTVIEKVVTEEKVGLIRTYDDWMKVDYVHLLADGVHPNDEGHGKLFETVKNFIEKNYIN